MVRGIGVIKSGVNKRSANSASRLKVKNMADATRIPNQREKRLKRML